MAVQWPRKTGAGARRDGPRSRAGFLCGRWRGFFPARCRRGDRGGIADRDFPCPASAVAIHAAGQRAHFGEAEKRGKKVRPGRTNPAWPRKDNPPCEGSLLPVTVVVVHRFAVTGGRCRRRFLRAGRETKGHGRECDDGENTHFRVSPPSVQVACGGHVVGAGKL